MKEIPPNVAIVALTAAGLVRAKALKGILADAETHGLRGRVDGADVTFADTMAHVRSLFTAGRPIVGLCAAGILIRAVAPLLTDKRAEPPVVAVAEDGSAAVPLLGGHHGANRLARLIAGATGGTAAVTAAGDVALGFAFDDPPPGWRVANPEAVKPLTAALLAGDTTSLIVESGDAGWITGSGARFTREAAALSIRVTDRLIASDPHMLVLHPPTLALGVGCERGVAPEEVIALAETTLKEAGLASASVACVVSVDVKADEPAVHALAAQLGVPARFFPVTRLEAETPRLANPSDTVFREVGCHGVAEAASLATVGSDGVLVVPKRKSARATCAVARAVAGRDLDPETIGRPQGRLAVVGIGPGSDGWRTPEATRQIAEATDVVGYRLYLDLVADLIAGKPRHESELSEEEARVRRALDLAAGGRKVALICSGDAGIYALAALVAELVDRENRPEWNRLSIAMTPGVSAMQAAAARAGAPLGHDFAAVSLSDLLTPWPDIEKRLEAAASGDFVLAIYNPVSKRRREGLIRAREILLRHRPADTPVILARNLGRDGERVETIALGELSPDRADMLTLVMIGSSRTRHVTRGMRSWTYTPRGYEAKMASAPERLPAHKGRP